MTIFLRVCLCFLVRELNMSHSDFWVSLNATAKWWFSSTDSSLYINASSEPCNQMRFFVNRNFKYNNILILFLLVLIKYWFVNPGWSTSWIAAEKIAAITSKGVKTAYEKTEHMKISFSWPLIKALIIISLIVFIPQDS